jgi:hypothetical protein
MPWHWISIDHFPTANLATFSCFGDKYIDCQYRGSVLVLSILNLLILEIGLQKHVSSIKDD